MVKHAENFKISDMDKSKVIDCEVCQLAKMRRKNVNKRRTRPPDKENEVVCCDTLGPLNPSKNGNKYVMFMGNRNMFVPYFTRTKSAAYPKIKEYFAMVDRQHGKDFIRRFRGDNEFSNNNSLKEFFAKEGIITEFTTSNNPSQNGRAERFNLTVMNMARAMLIESGLPLTFWEYAVQHATYILNRLSSKSDTHQRSGFERVHNKKPDLSNIRTFGEICYRKIPDKTKKLHYRGHKCKFLCIDEQRKDAAYVYDLTDQKVVAAHGISTESFPDILSESPVPGDDGDRTTHKNDVEHSTPTEKVPKSSTRTRKSPQRLIAEMNAVTLHEAYMVFRQAIKEPVSIREVWFCVDRDRWIIAMRKEIQTLTDNGTWIRVRRPKGKNIISCKWVFKMKKKADGSVEVYKARLVARGFKQILNEDYFKTYSPVAGKTTLRIFVVIALKFNLLMEQYDVPAAYVKASLQGEEIYIDLPEGFAGKDGDIGNVTTAADQEGTGNDPREVLRLEKGLYGLKQSGLYWNKEVHGKLCELGLKSLLSDKCLYILSEGSNIIIVLLYVDDILIASNWKEKKTQIVEELKRVYQIKELGKVDKFLGMNIDQQGDGKAFIGQENFVDEIIKKFNLQGLKERGIPLDKNERFEISEATPTKMPYRSLLGGLLYLSTCTRPDIAFAVNQAAKFNENPTEEHWEKLLKIVAYVKSTKSHGLWYNTKTSGDQVVQLSVYTDADWANCKDTRKSITGIMISLWGCPVMWKSTKQSIVATSTCLAEIVAACSGLTEADKIKELLGEMKFLPNSRPILYVDNKPAINLIENDKPPQTMKHLSIKYHSVREKIQDRSYKVEYCQTEHMLADIFTKALDKNRFTTLRKKLKVVSKN